MRRRSGTSVDSHFEGKVPHLKANYQRLLEVLHHLGPFQETAKQASIHLQKQTVFADVQLRKGYFNLEFKTDYPIDDPRITKHLQLSAHRFAHTVRITVPTDIDTQLVAWLTDAYHLSK